jgi:hypothetical protein
LIIWQPEKKHIGYRIFSKFSWIVRILKVEFFLKINEKYPKITLDKE